MSTIKQYSCRQVMAMTGFTLYRVNLFANENNVNKVNGYFKYTEKDIQNLVKSCDAVKSRSYDNLDRIDYIMKTNSEKRKKQQQEKFIKEFF